MLVRPVKGFRMKLHGKGLKVCNLFYDNTLHGPSRTLSGSPKEHKETARLRKMSGDKGPALLILDKEVGRRGAN